jgi:hypothetical protein
MSATTTQLLSSGEFCKQPYDTIPVKIESANVTFYSNNSKNAKILSCDTFFSKERCALGVLKGVLCMFHQIYLFNLLVMNTFNNISTSPGSLTNTLLTNVYLYRILNWYPTPYSVHPTPVLFTHLHLVMYFNQFLPQYVVYQMFLLHRSPFSQNIQRVICFRHLLVHAFPRKQQGVCHNSGKNNELWISFSFFLLLIDQCTVVWCR